MPFLESLLLPTALTNAVLLLFLLALTIILLFISIHLLVLQARRDHDTDAAVSQLSPGAYQHRKSRLLTPPPSPPELALLPSFSRTLASDYLGRPLTSTTATATIATPPLHPPPPQPPHSITYTYSTPHHNQTYSASPPSASLSFSSGSGSGSVSSPNRSYLTTSLLSHGVLSDLDEVSTEMPDEVMQELLWGDESEHYDLFAGGGGGPDPEMSDSGYVTGSVASSFSSTNSSQGAQ